MRRLCVARRVARKRTVESGVRISDETRARLAKIHQCGDDGALEPQMELEIPQDPEFEMGGGRALRHGRRLPALHSHDPQSGPCERRAGTEARTPGRTGPPRARARLNPGTGPPYTPGRRDGPVAEAVSPVGEPGHVPIDVSLHDARSPKPLPQLRRPGRRLRPHLLGRGERDSRSDRTERRGKDHHVQRHQRLLRAERGDKCCSGARTSPACARAPSRRAVWSGRSRPPRCSRSSRSWRTCSWAATSMPAPIRCGP